MSYEVFKDSITKMVMKSGGISVKFNNDSGNYSARCSNGVRFFANGQSKRMTVRWGSGHQAVATM